MLGDLRDEIVPRSRIPGSISDIFAPEEHFLLATNPSRTSLIASQIMLSLFLVGVSIVPITGLLFLGESGVLTKAFAALLWVGMILLAVYLKYVWWKSQFYGITTAHVIRRTGLFNHKVLIAPLSNVQMVSIDTGITDRWLKLSTIEFTTAASSGFGAFRAGAIKFSHVDIEEVMMVYSKARGQLTSNL